MLFMTLLTLPLVLASPLGNLPRRNEGSDHYPTVTLRQSSNTSNPGVTITGLYDETFNQDLYLGIPYALPPVGPRRFQPPEPYIYSEDIIAQQHGPACLQKPNNTADGHYGMSEDCLFLDVYSPHGNKKNQKTKIPVVVYIHGGSFIEGTASIYNGSYLVSHSQYIGKPIIFVAVNFRLGIFGFGYGSGFAENKAGNLALRDNIAVLQWVKNHIYAFGGDPDKVTLLDGSSGSGAISLPYFDPKIKLFKSAIMSSRAQSTPPMGPTGTTWEDAYQELLILTNCTSPEQTQNSFGCLRIIPAQGLLAAQFALKANPLWAGSFIFGSLSQCMLGCISTEWSGLAPSINGDLIPKSPYQLLEEGLFAEIPFITGNVKDEGTGFIPTSITSSQVAAVVQAIEPIDLSQTVVEESQQVYPNQPALGSPFGTGNETFGFDPAYKQASAIFGDVAFQAPRRHFLRAANAHGFGQTRTSQFEQISPDRPSYLGVSHATDVPYFFGEAKPGIGDPHYRQYNYTLSDSELSDIMMDYWINFIYHSNPNPQHHWWWFIKTNNLPKWPKYNTRKGNKNMLSSKFDQVEVIKDNHREKAMNLIYENANAFNYKRGLLAE